MPVASKRKHRSGARAAFGGEPRACQSLENVRGGGVGRRFAGTPQAPRIRQLLGDSTTFDFTPWHGAIDFVFIDACHDYAFAKSDTANALRLAPRGVIVWSRFPRVSAPRPPRRRSCRA